MAYVGTPIEVGNQFSSLVGKRFSGDASTTAFTLDVRANSALDIEVFVENVRQDPNSAYTVDGTTLTFTAAPPSGTNNIYVVHQAPTVASVSPTAGSVTASSFDNSVISGHTALATKPDATDEFLVSDAGTIKRIDYSLLTPISMVDRFRLTTSFSGTADPIASNFERADETGAGFIGTGMTQSSGVFTFPLTGIYLILAFFNLKLNGDIRDHNQQIQTTTDNSSFSSATGGDSFIQQTSSGNTFTTSFHSYTFDVTDTSTHKVRFKVDSDANTSTEVRGSSTFDLTSFTFIRLGDT